MWRIILSIFICTSLLACTSNEIGNSKDVNPDTIWFDYRISGEEGKEEVTTMLQFRFGGENGTTLVLNEPAGVELDGARIKGDSSKMTGAYYEVLKPISGFPGKHKIRFTDVNNKEYEEEFEFSTFNLKAGLPAEIKRSDLLLELEGLNAIDYVRIYASDTSFESPGINRVDTVQNGQLKISTTELNSLVNGPIRLELYREQERPVKNGTKEGGRISITYGVKRMFELKAH